MPADGINQPNNERPNYFAGQYLLEDDFQLEQQYHIDRQRWHHHLLHVAGIADGLKVEKTETALSVKVSGGSAIDPQGRQIILLDTRSVDLTQLVSNTKAEIPNGTYTLWIQYGEKKTGQQTTGDEITSRRWQEEPKFRLSSIEETEELTDCILLAKLAISNNAISGNIDNRDRIYSGLRLPSYGPEIVLQAQKGETQSLAELNAGLSLSGMLAVAGNVGIGKTNPSEKLDISGNIKTTGSIAGSSLSVTGNISATDAALTGKLSVTGNVGIGTTIPQQNLSIQAGLNLDQGNANAAQINPGITFGSVSGEGIASQRVANDTTKKNRFGLDFYTNNAVRLSITNTGNVGIGNTAPSEKLDVSGNIKANGSITGNSLSVGIPLVSVSGTTQTRTASTANIDLSGHVQLKEYGDTSVAFLQARDDRLNRDIGLQIRTQQAKLQPVGSPPLSPTVIEALRISPSGNVGIGNTSPSEKLDVSGNIKATGSIAGASLSATGNVEIGTTSSSAKLTIQTPGDYDGNTIRFESKKEPSLYYLNLNTNVTNGVVRWVFDQKNNTTTHANVLAFDRGNIGIGTATPLQTLDVNGRIHVSSGVIQCGGDTAITNTSDLGLYSQTNQQWIRIVTKNAPIRFFTDGGAGSTWKMSIENNGNILAGGTFSSNNSASDIKLKNNIAPLTNVLEKLEKIRGISFEWNELSKSLGFSVGQREIGVIAQELEAEFPELVYSLKAHDYKAVSYDKLAGVFIEAIKELKTQHDDLVRTHKGEIETLKAEVKSLKSLLTQPV